MNNPEIVKEFLVESYENLDQLDRDLVVLEKDSTDRQGLASIFRTIHTIKGNCGFLAFAKLGAVTHAGENLLGRLRDGRLRLNAEITTALLALVDAVREMLACIEGTDEEGDGDYAALINQLTRLSDGPGESAVAACPAPAPPIIDSPPSLGLPAAGDGEGRSLPGLTGDVFRKRDLLPPEDSTRALERQEGGDPRRIGEILVDRGVVRSEDLLDALQIQGGPRATSVSDSTIRVDVGLLDKLMTLVGELVLARNQVLQFTATQKDTTFLGTCQRLNLITTELQEGIMKTRMQPIATIWSKFPRVARDLALACGKQVRLVLEGKETELDKTLIQAIKDPLIHLVRNAIDHGIETAEVRRARGKPVEGRLSLRAFHEGGQVNIEIVDDGAGLDPQRIKLKALERGLITQEQATRMSDRELLHLIFLPGFSTAEKITPVSGRGVGMDVVKTNIEKIGGTVDLQSEVAQSTTVKIKIPLTLAIIPALIVTSGGDRYAIPQFSLLELVRLEGKGQNIERIHTTPVFRLRGSLLPLLFLDRELKSQPKHSTPEKHAVNIVILQADDRQFGLVVDDVKETEEIVVKPLSKRLKRIPLFAGATIMGDGRVALIVDVPGLAKRAGVICEVRNRTLADQEAKPPEGGNTQQTLLLAELGPEHRLAIPLSLVTRLEEIPLSAVERTARQDVVQYRGRILPLLDLAAVLQGRAPDAATRRDPLQVVIYSDPERSVGLVVDRVLDTVATNVDVQHASHRPGIVGTAVIGQRVTDLVDLPAILGMADPSHCEPAVASEGRA